MESVNEKSYSQTYWPWWRLALLGLNMIALVFSAILSWHFLKGGSMPGCDGGTSSCDRVLNSKWSMIAGIFPVSSLAVGAYLSIFFSCFYIGPSTEASIRRMAWSVMLILVGAIAGCAIWFFILQKWIIGEFCPYCMTTHVTGILLTTLVIWRSTREFKKVSNNTSDEIEENGNIIAILPAQLIKLSRRMVLVLTGLSLAGILAITQIGFQPISIYNQGKAQANLPVIDYKNAPLIGSPDAPNIITLLFDYECPHCQKIHLMLNDVALRYQGKVAFALCPAPLNSQCNPYIPNSEAFKNSCELTRISLAVWLARRAVFRAFENWMFTFESGNQWHPRNVEAARAKAIELIGKKEFEAALVNPWIDQYLQTCVRIYGQTVNDGKGGVPKLVFGSRWVMPEANSPEELIKILQKGLALPKP